MKKQYTKNRITAAIACWEKQLRAGNYKRLDEAVARKERLLPSQLEESAKHRYDLVFSDSPNWNWSGKTAFFGYHHREDGEFASVEDSSTFREAVCKARLPETLREMRSKGYSYVLVVKFADGPRARYDDKVVGIVDANGKVLAHPVSHAKYTKKQIAEAIKHWEKKLKRMDEQEGEQTLYRISACAYAADEDPYSPVEVEYKYDCWAMSPREAAQIAARNFMGDFNDAVGLAKPMSGDYSGLVDDLQVVDADGNDVTREFQPEFDKRCSEYARQVWGS